MTRPRIPYLTRLRARRPRVAENHRVYRFELEREGGGFGLTSIEGSVVARTFREARDLINKTIASYARQGAIKGNFVLRVRTGTIRFADRPVLILSTYQWQNGIARRADNSPGEA